MTIINYLNQSLLNEIQITRRTFLSLFLFYFAASNTYYLYLPFFQYLQGNKDLKANSMFLILNLFIAISLIFGGHLLKKIRECTLIYTWAMSLLVTTLVLSCLPNFYIQLFIICIQGLFHGLCILSFNVYFNKQTGIDKRGRIGGIIICFSLALAVLLLPLTFRQNFLPLFQIFLCFCALSVYMLKPETESLKITEKTIINNRKNFFFYYIPWLIFCFNNSLFPIITQQKFQQLFPEIVIINQLANFLGGCFGAIVAGFIADRFGRKPILIYGLTSLGIGYTLAGFTKNIGTIVILYFLNGLSWGIFLLLYHLVIWGELKKGENWTIYQSLALSTFHFSQIFGTLTTPIFMDLDIQVSVLTSAMVVFISNVFLIFARETLPSQHIVEVENIKRYINRVKRELKERG